MLLPAQVAHVQPPSPGVRDRPACLQQISCPSPEVPRKEGDGGKDSERKPGNNVANSKRKSGADHAHLPPSICLHALPKPPAPPCCIRGFDIQTFSSSRSKAVGWIPLCPAAPSRSLDKEQKPQQLQPPELPTPCGCKGHLEVQGGSELGP